MARYRDDDDRDDRDDDRPRRRRERDDDPPKKGGGTGMVLLIVGLAVGIPVLVCGGVIVYFVYVAQQVVKKVEQFGDDFKATTQGKQAADGFLAALSRNDVSGAYTTYTTDNYRRTVTQDQLAAVVKANPVLGAPNDRDPTGLPSPTGTAPNRKLTVTYTISPDTFDQPEDDPEMQPNPRPRPGGVRPPPTAPKPPVAPPPGGKPPAGPPPRTVAVTLTLVEQPDGTWKVDSFTVS